MWPRAPGRVVKVGLVRRTKKVLWGDVSAPDPLLVAAGHRVVTLDLRGEGETIQAFLRAELSTGRPDLSV
jgi:hypothetical protein